MISELELEVEHRINAVKKAIGTGTSENVEEFSTELIKFINWFDNLDDSVKKEVYSFALVKSKDIRNMLNERMNLIENIREEQVAVHSANSSYGVY